MSLLTRIFVSGRGLTQSSVGRFLLSFFRERFLFWRRRRSFEARVGFVGRRERRGESALRKSSPSTSRQRSRFRRADRSSLLRICTIPSADIRGARAVRRRSSSCSLNASESRIAQESVTLVALRLACCPPGPPAASCRKVSSRQGMMRPRRQEKPEDSGGSGTIESCSTIDLPQDSVSSAAPLAGGSIRFSGTFARFFVEASDKWRSRSGWLLHNPLSGRMGP